MQTIALPQGMTLRHATHDDVPAITELTRLCETQTDGVPETTLADMRTFVQMPTLNLATDAWVVFAAEGELAAYAIVSHRQHARIYVECDVHPAYCGRGIGSYLLHLAQERAMQHIPEAPAEARVTFSVSKSRLNVAAQQLFEARGFQQVRAFWRMAIELNEVPPVAQWAEGIEVRTMAPGMEQAVHEADEEAFLDHWGHLPLSYEEWRLWTMDRENFDASLWFLAMEGDEIAAFALCQDEKENGGWVHVLGVRRPWRRKGLGLALLHHSFTEFYNRGIKTVYLGVDAQSLTGATRLYERAGMHADRQSNRYEKELRAGKELSTQTLDA